MDHVWNTSKYLSKRFVALCQIKVIQGQKVKKGQIKHFDFAWCGACF